MSDDRPQDDDNRLAKSLTMSLFKRPAWAKTQATEEEDTHESLFSHSSRHFNEIFAEEQRKKKERAEKQRLKQERKERKSSSKREKDEGADLGSGSGKRRRITAEQGEELFGSIGLSSAAVNRRGRSRGEPDPDDDRAISRQSSPRFNKVASRDNPRIAISSTTSAPASTVIELESENEVEPQPSSTTLQAEPVEEESDDEFADLIRQARAKKLKQDEAKKSQTPDVRSPTPGQDAAEAGRSAYPTPPPPPDPPVKLFVSSQLPGTQPLIIYRKLSQRLQEIRQVWCKKQGLSEQFTKDVYLIHRMRKLYDVTTCKSLGLYVDDQGQIAMKGAENEDDVDQVHLEAVTDEIFAKKKAEKEREDQKRRGLLEGDKDAEIGASETQKVDGASKGESLIRILLKAKAAHEPFKLKVKPVSVKLSPRLTQLTNRLVYTFFEDHDRLQRKLQRWREAVAVAGV